MDIIKLTGYRYQRKQEKFNNTHMKRLTFITMLFISLSNSLFAQWTTNGTNIYNSNTGNVGVGTAAPGNLFEVSGATASPLTITRTTAASNISMEFKTPTGSWFAGQGSAGNFGIATNNNIGVGAPFNITTSGNVGIGTTTPGNLLEVSGTIPSPLTITRTTASNISLEFKNASGSWFAGLTSTGNFGIATNNNLGVSTAFNITTSGNVGIGTTAPGNLLEVSGNIPSPLTITRTTASNIGLEFKNAIGSWFAGQASTGNFGIATNNNIGISTAFNITTSGNVGIGTANPLNKLDVSGTIHSKAVSIDLNGWNDYVFKKDYRLPSLSEVKTYIGQHQHLPEVPSEQEMIKNGLDVAEMNKLLMKKVEELTLYLIEIKEEKDKEIKELAHRLALIEKSQTVKN
jgi:hypothetical protein